MASSPLYLNYCTSELILVNETNISFLTYVTGMLEENESKQNNKYSQWVHKSIISDVKKMSRVATFIRTVLVKC
jgi:hypothetical protein